MRYADFSLNASSTCRFVTRSKRISRQEELYESYGDVRRLHCCVVAATLTNNGFVIYLSFFFLLLSLLRFWINIHTPKLTSHRVPCSFLERYSYSLEHVRPLARLR